MNQNNTKPALMMVRVTRATALLCCIFLGSCSGSGGGDSEAGDNDSPPVTMISISLSPSSVELNLGESSQFQAIGTFSDASQSNVTSTAEWAVAATSVATVDNVANKGRVQSVAEGSTSVSATLNGVSGSANVSVTSSAPVLVSIDLLPTNVDLKPGQSVQFQANGAFSDTSETDVTNIAEWAVAATSVATVDNGANKGRVQSVAEGRTSVSATLDGVSESATVNVGGSGPALGPLRVSNANSRYFEDASGKIVYLTGSHTWLNLQDGVLGDPPPQFGYDAWLSFLEQHNHNFFRLWVFEQSTWMVNAPSRWNFTPPRYQRTGPGNAIDGKPRFDLTKFNQSFFDRLRQRVVSAGDRGIYVSVMLFDGWSVAFPKGGNAASNPWNGHPYNIANNINGIDGDINGDNSGIESHELGSITPIQEQLVQKIIDTVNDLDNVLYEISNESHSDSLQWQYHMIDFIRDYESGKPKQHPIGMTINWPDGQNSELFASGADWISPNGDIDNPRIANGAKVVVADTDHLCGICGTRQWVWKSMLRGENPIFMDPYIDVYDILDYDINNAQDVSLRRNMGYARMYADRIDLKQAVPCGQLSSTGYCLGYASIDATEYLIYAPNGGSITVDLAGTSGLLDVEWFNPGSGVTQGSPSITGGPANQVFVSPFQGDAVLYISAGT